MCRKLGVLIIRMKPAYGHPSAAAQIGTSLPFRIVMVDCQRSELLLWIQLLTEPRVGVKGIVFGSKRLEASWLWPALKPQNHKRLG
jgi:hypothetical protein